MSFQRVLAIARKEWRHLLRDPRSLALMLLMPAMLLFLFGYAIRLDVQDAPLGVWQKARDAASNDLVARFQASRAFEVTGRYHDRRSLLAALQAGEIWAGLVIPEDYARALQSGRAGVQLILDGTDANSARLIRNYAISIVNELSRERGSTPPVRVEDRLWFNQGRESRLAILPGVIAVVMAVVGALMTSLTVAKEMELGNLVMLRTTPLRRREFLLGKLTPYFVIGMLDVAIAVAAAVHLFGVPLRGPLIGLASVSALFMLVVLLQGALISIVAGQQVLASQMALVSTFLPAFLLSGFIFAIQNMPIVLQYLTLLVPARYYVSLTKAIFLKGASPLILWSDVAALGVIATALSAIVAHRARKLGLLD